VVLDQLMPRVLHCCYGDTWPVRMGGVSALRLLLPRLPLDYMSAWLPATMRALYMVMRWLPEHCTNDAHEIQALLERIVSRCFLVSSPPPAPF
jgi:transformation/transcription domain-associated protein